MLRNKVIHDRQVMASRFKKGVWLKVEQIKKGQCEKFIFDWKGPYIVVENIRDTNYVIKPLNKRGRPLVVNRVRLKRHYQSIDRQELPQIENSVNYNKKHNKVREIIKRARTMKVQWVGRENNVRKVNNDVDANRNAQEGNRAQETSNQIEDVKKIPEKFKEKDKNFRAPKINQKNFVPDRPVRSRKPPDRYVAN
ncbi:hypothetical protein BpHYR1_035375 [Brachionus plicatilis]|uniref:Uncharacterized protein n=1 Tax=Brachionus plicatilis TaxID=10195 RepID=A0A3M7QZH0_BRAPC|nr:hypothetical protein BpHYR1_035375 [Brachionus plicatilis]